MSNLNKPIGIVTHYYDKISVAVINLSSKLKVGDSIKFSHHDDEFTQTVSSMQKDHQTIEKAGKGEEIAVKTDPKVHSGDKIYFVS